MILIIMILVLSHVLYCTCKSVLGVLLQMAGFGFQGTAYSFFLEKQVSF